uniref:Uncharacterized protein n=1 Tax=Panagrolaimus sp. JU765 TaxID=591449 RepID=A0AC34RLN2_9BILA
MQDSPNLIDKPRKNVMASVEVEEERENLSTVSAGADGSQSSGRCVADPLQQMSEEEQDMFQTALIGAPFIVRCRRSCAFSFTPIE